MKAPFCLVALMLPALALADTGEVTVGLAGGVVATDQLEPLGPGATGMLRVGVGLIHGISLEADLAAIKGKTRYQDVGYTGFTPRLSFVGKAIPDARFSPLLVVGAGAFVKRAEDYGPMPQGFKEHDVDFMLNLGAGVVGDVTDDVSLRFDTRLLNTFGTESFANHSDTFVDWEFTVGVQYTFGGKDTDGDGITDGIDLCPTEPEDFDGFEDDDGCPDNDNDGDGIPDNRDQCPMEAEDVDGFEDEDGCPDLDNDGDGIPDLEDKCPLDFGTEATGGCPDRDGDTVVDAVDECPDAAGPVELMGCPDFDEDGVPDHLDECVEDAGLTTAYGCSDADGDGVPDLRDACPDEPTHSGSDTLRSNGCPTDAYFAPGQILFTQPFEFRGNDTLAGNSRKLIAAAAKLLAEHPELKVAIQVHTDPVEGKREDSLQRATLMRAVALKDALIAKGIADTRIGSKGMGTSEPIEGAESSARIEFLLIEPAPPEPTKLKASEPTKIEAGESTEAPTKVKPTEASTKVKPGESTKVKPTEIKAGESTEASTKVKAGESTEAPTKIKAGESTEAPTKVKPTDATPE